MGGQKAIDWIVDQLYAGKPTTPRKQEEAVLLSQTLDRFLAYLSNECGIDRIEDTTPEALHAFEFDLPANDDHHLRLVFSHLGRSDLLEFLGRVSADKYFRNKKLTGVLKAMAGLKGYVRDLRKAEIRMASELLERGATPEGRAQLVEATGVPAESLLKMVQACDLCRMTGMAGKTLMRSFAMGYDTLQKLRATTPEQIEAEFDAYLCTTGERANRMVVFSSFVRQAGKLDDVIVY